VQQETAMPLKHTALAAAIFAACAAVNPPPAAAQVPNCLDMYNRVMQLFQAAPQSPAYAQMAAAYSANCLGPAAGPAYPPPGYPPPAYGYAPVYDYGPVVGVGVGFGYGGGWRGGWGGGWHR
jgi:hypothetical protein